MSEERVQCSAGLAHHASQTRASDQHRRWDKRDSGTYAVTLGTRGATGALGSEGLGHQGSQEHQQYQERPEEAEQIEPGSGGHRAGGKWVPGAALKPAGYLHWHL